MLGAATLNGEPGPAIAMEIGKQVPKGLATAAMMLTPMGEEEVGAEAGGGLLKWLKGATKKCKFWVKDPRAALNKQVFGLAERIRAGQAKEVFKELEQLAQTQEGRQQLLDLHRAVSDIIPLS